MPTLDPRARLGIALLYGGVVVASHHPGWLLAELGIVVLLVLLAREGQPYLRWLALVAAMVLSWFAIAWLSLDLHTALLVSLRLLVLMSTFFLFFRTTDPEDLGNALMQMGLPHALAFVLSAGLQFVPVISQKAQQVFDAQRARGIPLEPGWSSLRHYPALFGPLLVQAFRLADELAEAMESRGFSRPGRTSAASYRMGTADWLVLAVGVGVLVVVWLAIGQ